MGKITTLPQDTAPTGADYTVTVETSSGQTKKVLLSDMITLMMTGTLTGVLNKSLLTTDSNPYKFSAYMGSNQTTVATTWTKLNMDTEEFDTNSNYSTSTYGYTIPVSGFYLFNVGVQLLSQAGVAFLVGFSKDGTTEWKRGQEIPNTTGNIALYGTTFAQLTAGEIIYPIYYSISASKTLQSGAIYSRFNGFLVSKT